MAKILDPMALWQQAGGGTPAFDLDRWRNLIRERILSEGSEFPDPADMNWELLKDLYKKPHQLIRDIDTVGLHFGIVELLDEAKAVHHLLDLVDVPYGYSADTRAIDDRTLLAVRGIMTLRERLARIADWHTRETGPAGTFGDLCTECGHRWPCDSRRMADGVYAEDED